MCAIALGIAIELVLAQRQHQVRGAVLRIERHAGAETRARRPRARPGRTGWSRAPTTLLPVRAAARGPCDRAARPRPAGRPRARRRRPRKAPRSWKLASSATVRTQPPAPPRPQSARQPRFAATASSARRMPLHRCDQRDMRPRRRPPSAPRVKEHGAARPSHGLLSPVRVIRAKGHTRIGARDLGQHANHQPRRRISRDLICSNVLAPAAISHNRGGLP